jgi:hypothetical protein
VGQGYHIGQVYYTFGGARNYCLSHDASHMPDIPAPAPVNDGIPFHGGQAHYDHDDDGDDWF